MRRSIAAEPFLPAMFTWYLVNCPFFLRRMYLRVPSAVVITVRGWASKVSAEPYHCGTPSPDSKADDSPKELAITGMPMYSTSAPITPAISSFISCVASPTASPRSFPKRNSPPPTAVNPSVKYPAGP